MADVIDIRDARARRAVGIPLNGRELPAPAIKVIKSAVKAACGFRKCIYAYTDKPNTNTFAAMKRAFDRFIVKSVSDDPIGAAILATEFDSIRTEWADAFERFDTGEEVRLGTPMWPWEDTLATKWRNANPALR